jgi:SAM-dependent methyltransferase
VRTEEDAYDAVAYPSFPYPDTHADHLATMAILHGLDPAPVEQCRVLEIACNEGANLIPMAYAIPGSEFVGFDLAGLPIKRGQERIRELGMQNVRLFQANLLDVGAELGQFDYIIAHGLYAWVPEPVRDRLLAVCGQRLAPHGVAFVSYNALPGSHLRNMIREMMLYRVKSLEEPALRVTKGLEFLRFLSEAREEGDAYRLLIERQIKQMQTRSPEALHHDELSAIHHPLYFSEFVDHAGRHGLQYLSESVLPPPTDPRFRLELLAAIEEAAGGDLIAQEQMLDFVRMRMYRETLLCRADRVVCRDFSLKYLRRLWFASQATSTQGDGGGTRIYTLPGGIKMEAGHPATIALMEQLTAAWPHAIRFEDIEPQLTEAGLVLDSEVSDVLMRLAVAKMIELHAWNPPFAREISKRPKVTAVSRQEAGTRAHATTLWHSTVRLDDPTARSFLKLLNGTRDRDALLGALKEEFPQMSSEQLVPGIEANLRFLYRAGFLEA